MYTFSLIPCLYQFSPFSSPFFPFVCLCLVSLHITHLLYYVPERLGISSFSINSLKFEPAFTNLLHGSMKFKALIFSLNFPRIFFPLLSNSHATDVDIKARFSKHTPESYPMGIGKEITMEIAVEDVSAWNEVFSEELALAHRCYMIWHCFSIFHALIESADFVNQQLLDRIRETS